MSDQCEVRKKSVKQLNSRKYDNQSKLVQLKSGK